MWDLLRRGGQHSSGELALASGAASGSVASYMSALIAHGYVARLDAGMFQLLQDTGARAPSTNAAAGTLHDWNLKPPMAGAELRELWEGAKVTLSAFGVALGMGHNAATRLREMMDGSRPISPAVEEAARKLTAAPSAKPRRKTASSKTIKKPRPATARTRGE